MKVSVIVPTMNEEAGIVKVLKRIPKEYELIVVDKSTDNTAKLARKAGAKVIIQKDKGKGNAMRLAAKKARGDVIVFIDGDETYPPEDIPKLIDLIDDGNDLVYGARIRNRGNMSLGHVIGNAFFTGLANLFYGKTSDLLTGMFAIKKKKFLNLNLKSEGFAIETEIFILARKAGLKVAEIKVEYADRAGKAKLNTWGDGIKILKTLLRNI